MEGYLRLYMNLGVISAEQVPLVLLTCYCVKSLCFEITLFSQPSNYSALHKQAGPARKQVK